MVFKRSVINLTVSINAGIFDSVILFKTKTFMVGVFLRNSVHIIFSVSDRIVKLLYFLPRKRRYANALFVVVVCPSRTSRCCIETTWRFELVFTARCYASAVLAMALCPSVCLSVISRSSTKTAKGRITQTTPHDSPGTLVFWSQRSPRNSTGVTPAGAPNGGGVGQNRRLSTNSWLYLDKKLSYRHEKSSLKGAWSGSGDPF